MDINQLTTFFGWCSVINLAFYLLSALFVLGFKSFTVSIHSKISGLSESQLQSLYFSFLGHYKIAILVLNLVPYVALKLMTQ